MMNNLLKNDIFTKDTFRWGVSSLGTPNLSFLEVLSLAKNYRFGFVELRTLSGTTNIQNELNKFIVEHPQKVDEIKEHNFVVGINTSATLVNSKEQTFEELVSYGKIADKLNCKYLRVFGGFDFKEEFTNEHLKQSKATITRFNQYKEELGLKCNLILEMHDGYSSTERVAQLIDYCGIELPIIWDAHHTYMAAQEPIEQTWNSLKEVIVHVHIKDSKRTGVGDKSQLQSCLPGEGEMVGRELIELLRREKFDGSVSLEWEKFWEPTLPELEDAISSLISNSWV